VEAIERALESEVGCADVLQVIVSVRGAVNGLMAEVIEDHVRCHVGAPSLPAKERAEGTDELIEVVRSYLKWVNEQWRIPIRGRTATFSLAKAMSRTSAGQGATSRFLKIYDEYKKAPEVTRQRMYLETMERLFGGTDKIIMDSGATGGIVPAQCRLWALKRPADLRGLGGQLETARPWR
jgi:FrmR/RcnR family transcriptional regulator, repressor of frmRAB operon